MNTNRGRLRGLVTLAMTIAVTVFLLGGCEQAKEAVNKGGDTPCSEFTQQDQDKQRVKVRKYLQQETKLTPTADPAQSMPPSPPSC